MTPEELHRELELERGGIRGDVAQETPEGLAYCDELQRAGAIRAPHLTAGDRAAVALRVETALLDVLEVDRSRRTVVGLFTGGPDYDPCAEPLVPPVPVDDGP